MQPFNRLGVKVFLREARRKVWANAVILNDARRHGRAALHGELARLERRSARRVDDLTRPKRVIAELTIRGFGVELGS
jgi:hypothetical protein